MFQPFRAWRYDESVAGPIKDLVSQPYDKISPSALAEYRKRSEFNIVHAIRGESESGDTQWHADAADTVSSWMESGVWRQESAPAYYVYEQEFTDAEGTTHTRRGITGAFQLSGRDNVLHHERTHAGIREDRRRLIDATGLHFGQIFVLRTEGAPIDPSWFSAGEETACVEDAEGTCHSYSAIRDPKIVEQISAAYADARYVIADGHHRFTVAMSHADDNPGASVMMTAVDIEDPGLLVPPTHRVLTGLPSTRRDGLAPLFQRAGAREIPRTDDPTAFLDAVKAGGIGTVGVVVAGGFFLLEMDTPGGSNRAVDALDAEKLQNSVIGPLLKDLSMEEHLSYRRSGEAAVSDVLGGDSDVAFILNGIPPRDVATVAEQGDVMPQKSTDFYPKLLAGFAVLDAMKPQ